MTGQQIATSMSDYTGAFTIPSLPAGNYVACAQPETPGLLDPCQWGTSAPAFTVTAGQTTSGVKITLAQGAVIPIHVNDPQQLLKPILGGRVDTSCRIHLVTAKGMHYEAPIVAQSVGGRDHSATVPFGTPYSLQVLCPALSLNDATGNPVVSANSGTPIQAGATASTTVFTVTGAKQ